MSDTSLPPQLVSATVFRHWAEGLGETTPTLFPGLRGDTSSWSEWYEIWVDQWSARPQRQHAPELSDVRVTVHAFVKAGNDLGRIQELMRQAQTLLNGRTLAIVDPEQSGAPILGYLKLREPDVKELTRMDADASRHGLQHHVAQWRGIAQCIAAPAAD